MILIFTRATLCYSKLLTMAWPCLSVCLSVCHKSVFYRNRGTDRADFFGTEAAHSITAFKEIRVSPKQGYFISRSFRRVVDKGTKVGA